MRTFDTGANRDTDHGKLDFEGFLSPAVLERYAEYMHGKRTLADGSVRDSDNWQKGIPISAYVKSLWRHFFAVWKSYRRGVVDMDDCCGALFNLMGLMHETLKSNTADVPFLRSCGADFDSGRGNQVKLLPGSSRLI